MGLVEFIRSLFGGAAQPERPGGRDSVLTTPNESSPEPSGPATPSSDPATDRPAASGPVRTVPEPVEAGPLAPLSNDEALAAARKGQLGRLLWTETSSFSWRQDRIPPATSRTTMIERAMIGRGLISGEELARLRSIYDSLPQLHPTDDQAARAGHQAVVASRAERAAIKAQKKAEAADRRAQHEAAVAERFATDIVFLGRGVSNGLAKRQSDAAKLDAAGLPVLASPADVAELLEIDIPALRWLAFHHPAARLSHYARFEVPKKSGGTRSLASPKPRLRAAQSILLDRIVRRLPVDASSPAHGFIAGRSIATGAAPHVGADVVLNMDLADFFPSITWNRVRGLLESLGYSPAAATVLSLLMTDSPRRLVSYDGQPLHVATGPRSLPQGACTSPGLSNAIARTLDTRLAGYATSIGWTYTRYADDLTFSAFGEPAQQVGRLIARVRHVAQEEGFAVNAAKTRVQRSRSRQSVTGVIVNDVASTPRALRRRLRAILHNAKTTGLEAQNTDGHENFAGWIEGQIGFISMVNAEQGAALRAAYDELSAN